MLYRWRSLSRYISRLHPVEESQPAAPCVTGCVMDLVAGDETHLEVAEGHHADLAASTSEQGELFLYASHVVSSR